MQFNLTAGRFYQTSQVQGPRLPPRLGAAGDEAAAVSVGAGEGAAAAVLGNELVHSQLAKVGQLLSDDLAHQVDWGPLPRVLACSGGGGGRAGVRPREEGCSAAGLRTAQLQPGTPAAECSARCGWQCKLPRSPHQLPTLSQPFHP